MVLKCIIVEDSTIQRLVISKMVNNAKQLVAIGEFSNALEANNFLINHQVDLIFLDVEMPEISGFDLLDGLARKPQIIFVTGKADYAFKAFDYDATDYLKKPITLERFEIALNKALKKANNIEPDFGDNNNFMFIKSNLKNHKIYTDSIKWVEAMGDYIKVVTDDQHYLVLNTMKAFEKDLPANQFLRVHKSYIINLKRLKKYTAKFAEIDKTQIPLSRTIKQKLKEALLNFQ
jgi:DNA-binding LytR/AlgR family response regulator